MAKLTPKRNFLLRIENGKRIRAVRGQQIEVTEQEHKKLNGYFVEVYGQKKKSLSVK